LVQVRCDAGFRSSHIDQTDFDGGWLLYNPADPSEFASSSQSFAEKSNTYLAAARYHITDDALLYARRPAVIVPAADGRFHREHRPTSRTSTPRILYGIMKPA